MNNVNIKSIKKADRICDDQIL